MCFRLKLDYHNLAKCQTRVQLENQQWSQNMAGVCLEGPCYINLGDSVAHLLTLCITCERLHRDPSCQLLNRVSWFKPSW